MQERKFDIGFAFFSYAGNGGISAEHPSIRRWWSETAMWLKQQPSIGRIAEYDLCDTPITMTRNAAVVKARSLKLDILVMIDSDQWPDRHVGRDPYAKPFVPTSLAFILKRFDKGPVVIGAPYCGPPPHENVYVFRWRDFETDDPNPRCRLDQYSREEAAERAGFEAVGALPTGLTMWDMRCFDVFGPDAGGREWFYYEYNDKYCAKKDSTEDVTATRDLSLAGIASLGYNPVFCNWDSWAGHMKSKCVEKPQLIYADQVSGMFRNAAQRGVQRGIHMVEVGADGEEGVPVAAGTVFPGTDSANGNGHAKPKKVKGRVKG